MGRKSYIRCRPGINMTGERGHRLHMMLTESVYTEVRDIAGAYSVSCSYLIERIIRKALRDKSWEEALKDDEGDAISSG